MDQYIFNALFDTHAIRVCQADFPFWYTSGKLGPFFINTHFVYGDQESAIALLDQIETAAGADRTQFIAALLPLMEKNYETSAIYRGVIDRVVEAARGLDFDLISGGERRDFFFSVLAAKKLGVPHLSIFKDGSCFYTDDAFEETVAASEVDLSGKRSLHIVDLITVASSFTRAWIPFADAHGVKITQALTVIDRMQGGSEILAQENISTTSLLQIDMTLFEKALRDGEIDEDQFALVRSFLEDPEAFMAKFLESHPNFIRQQIMLGGKCEERARLAIEKGYADLPSAL